MLSALFVSFAISTDASCFKKCENMRFCRENLKTSGSWSIEPDSVIIQNNELHCELLSNNIQPGLKMTVYGLEAGGIRTRIDIIEPELFSRFDLSKEHCSIDQSIIDQHVEFEHISTHNASIMKFNDGSEVHLAYSQLKLEIHKNGNEIIQINPMQSLLVEHHLPAVEADSYEGFEDPIANGPTAVRLDFEFLSTNNEEISISGLAERAGHLSFPDTGDKPIRLFNTDAFKYEYDNPIHIYGTVPFAVGHSSSYTAGIFWMNPSDTFVAINTTQTGRNIKFLSEGGYIDFVVYVNDFKSIINEFTTLTGKPAMPQMFAFGYHQCRWGYLTQNEVEMVARGLDESSIPYDAMWLDLDHLADKSPFAFNRETFPKPEQLIEDHAAKHRYIIRLSDAHFPYQSQHRQYLEFEKENLFVMLPNQLPFTGECWPGNSVWPDLLNPRARELWAQQYSYEVDTANWNVFFWNDMNEPAIFDSSEKTFPKSAIHYGNIENREVHNLYGLLNTVGTSKGLIERNVDKNIRPFILTRSFFAGSQRYTWTWTGDNTANWGHLASSLSMIMCSGLCGMPFTGADVGGFWYSAKPELLVRWYQVGSTCYPFFREHCMFDAERREPYLFEGQIFEALKSAIHLRYKMLALWYTASRNTNLTGISPVQPLWVEFPQVQALHQVDTQVIIGGVVMVAPVLEENASAVQVISPPGLWYSMDGQVYQGDSVKVGLFDTPMFVRGGKILPIFSSIGNSTYETVTKPLTLLVALDENGSSEGEIYIDDGESYNYTRGEYIHMRFISENGEIKSKKGDQKSIPPHLRQNIIDCVKIFGAETAPEGSNAQFEDGVLVFSGLSLGLNDEWAISFA